MADPYIIRLAHSYARAILNAAAGLPEGPERRSEEGRAEQLQSAAAAARHSKTALLALQRTVKAQARDPLLEVARRSLESKDLRRSLVPKLAKRSPVPEDKDVVGP